MLRWALHWNWPLASSSTDRAHVHVWVVFTENGLFLHDKTQLCRFLVNILFKAFAMVKNVNKMLQKTMLDLLLLFYYKFYYYFFVKKWVWQGNATLTDSRHREGETQNTDSHNTIKVKQPVPSFSTRALLYTFWQQFAMHHGYYTNEFIFSCRSLVNYRTLSLLKSYQNKDIEKSLGM